METIKQLREATNASISECANALKKAKNNVDLAIEYLLYKNKITENKISQGYYAIDNYVESLKQQALKEMISIKSEITNPIKKIKFYTSDNNLLIDYLLIYEDEAAPSHQIQLDVPSNMPQSIDDKDYVLLSFCFQQLEKNSHEINEALTWGDHYKLPTSLLLYELLLGIKDLSKMLIANNFLVANNVVCCVGDHENDYDDAEELLLSSMTEAQQIFGNSPSFDEFLTILYDKKRNFSSHL